jgi:hypothetical protein
MSESEVAWAAGFYEGEGSLSFRAGKTMHMSLPQKNRWPLDRFIAIMGVGKVRGPYGVAKGRSIYSIDVVKREEIRVLFAKLEPWLSPRRQEQIRVVFEKYENRVLKGSWHGQRTHCPKGHPLDGRATRSRYCKTCNRINARAHWLAGRGMSKEEARIAAEQDEKLRGTLRVVEAS